MAPSGKPLVGQHPTTLPVVRWYFGLGTLDEYSGFLGRDEVSEEGIG